MIGPTARIALLCLLALAGCGDLPRGAPTEREVLRSAEDLPDVQIYPVTRETLPALAHWPTAYSGGYASWPGRAQVPVGRRVIAPGDTLGIAVWDGSEFPLLSGPGAPVANLTDVRVGEGGTVFVPYLGVRKVSGMTPEAARRNIQRGLSDLIDQPQVQIVLQEGRHNSVDAVAGVAAPGIYPMPDRSFTVLSLIAAAGGVSPSLRSPRVKLIRGGRTHGMLLDAIYDAPRLDATLKGGDRIIVEQDDRYFIAFGASGVESLIDFPKEEVSAMDAVGLIQGINDARGNPEALLVLRQYVGSSLVKDGGVGPVQARVIFTIDLTTADGLFSAQSFRIAPGDIVLATESPVVNLRTIFGIIGGAIGTTNTVTSVGN